MTVTERLTRTTFCFYSKYMDTKMVLKIAVKV